jgi:hypothetical protein
MTAITLAALVNLRPRARVLIADPFKEESKMKLTHLVPCATVAALVACGGSSTSTDAFRANAPTFDKVAVSQNDSQTAAPAQVASGGGSSFLTAPAPATCHPHLFDRAGEIIGRVNRHFFKLVGHVADVITDNPKIASEGSRTWENVRNGIDRKFTITAVANLDGSTTYNFELDVKSTTGTAGFVKVMSGSMTHTGPAEAHDADAGPAVLVEDKGTISFDYTALATVVTTEHARGQITDAFDNVRDPVKGVKRTASIALTNFLPEEGDPHGPRNGSYSWEREPSVGGKFQFQDSLVLLCPNNPTNAASDLTAVARWYHSTDGVHGRSDAKATGGQMLTGQTWMGVTCAKGQTISSPAEGYWMMKLEDASGATVSGQADTVGLAPCDPVFGAVPSLSNNATDYNFAAAVTFPGEW